MFITITLYNIKYEKSKPSPTPKEASMKKALKIAGCVLLALVILVLGYVAYVFLDYHRIEDNLTLTAQGSAASSAQPGVPYTVVSYNIGFGAYEDDYSFFMDGGTESWAWSKERLDENLSLIAQTLKDQMADFYFIQEVDTNSTRSYHRNEADILRRALTGYSSVWGQNYDSPFLFWPLTQPHGSSVSGLMTFSSAPIASSLRRSLPIETGVMKLVDLDRCYTVSRVPMENGRELILYAVHLSAYTSDGTIAIKQMEMLLDDMQAEYEKGNYCVCGGDFNRTCWGTPIRSSASVPGTTPGPSPYRQSCSAGRTLPRSPLWIRITPSPAAATPTPPTTVGSMWSLWTASWCRIM